MTKKITHQEYHLKRNPVVNPKTKEARETKVCVIADCVNETHRGNAVKCLNHRGTCAQDGCDTPSWDTNPNARSTKPSGKSYEYKYGKDFRYCGLHKSRIRAQRKLDAPKHSRGLSEVTFEDLAIDKIYNTTSINPQGYVLVYVRLSNGSTRNVLEHRIVMEEYLGRALFAHENVHHLNGNRADNRLENLELWSVSQPPGQRVQDKIAHYKEFLEQYGITVELSEESEMFFDESKVEERKAQNLHFRHPDFENVVDSSHEEHDSSGLSD